MPRFGSHTIPISPSRFRRAVQPLVGLAVVLACAFSLEGCDRIKTVARNVARPASASPDYLSPPSPTGSALLADGKVSVQGSAPAESRISFRSPEGQSAETRADPNGRWSVTLDHAATPHLYAFDATLDARTIRAQGALCLLPSGAVLVLRAGSGATVIGEARGLSLTDVDFDGEGGVAASGLAAANAPIRLMIDGAAAGLGQADAQGRYVVMGLDLRRAPVVGTHNIGVQSSAGLAAVADVSLAPPAPLAETQIYRARAVQGGWRIDWRLPGGGLQTAVVFSPIIKGARS